jgi:acyl-CoA synthetase (AMP-forming)/AMP-acid ligase II
LRIEALFADAPDRPALIAGEDTLSYPELRALAEAKARALGDVAGQRILVLGPNVPEFVVGLLAVWIAGGVAVPLGARAREHEISTTLAHSGAAHAIALQPDALAGRALAAPGEPVDAAAILYTSGSTGQPKGAYLTHAGALHWGRTLADLLELTPEDRTALVIPLSHAFGMASLLACFAAYSAAVLVEQSRSAEPLIRALEHATVLNGSPAVFAGLKDVKVRTGLVGGAASPPGLIERLDRSGARILNVFGMTEIGAACACRPGDPPEKRYTTAGRAMPGYELRIADGQLEARGKGVTPGYHNGPRTEGWFRTGDMATIDDGGWVTIHGRAEEVIHVGGFNVFPAEVESFLLTHPDVVQAAVLGGAHPRMGEVVRAFVVARPGSELTPGAVLRFARGKIAGYKVPYGIEIVPELPKLPGGKVDKRALRA